MKTRPVKILQFGEGVFMRGFLDWMVDQMNARTGFGGEIAVIKPRPGEISPAYARQANLFTVVFKGLSAGKSIVSRARVASIARVVNPYTDPAAFLAEADNPDLVTVASNTTESGITDAEGDEAPRGAAPSFPGKLTQILRRRYETFSGDPRRGLLILPFELIEANGATLQAIVQKHADRWYSDPAFIRWIETANQFLDTLVDRIVPGFSEEERAAIKAETGFEDDLVVVAEPYHFLAIKGPPALERVLPFREAGLNVHWTEDLSSRRLLKVRLLNGSHTFMTMCGLAMGVGDVRAAVASPTLREALTAMHSLETIPTLPFPRAEGEAYLATVLERFANPFLDHRLISIALNSVSKWKARLMPPLLEHAARKGSAPALLSFSLAALIARYTSGVEIQDDAKVIAFFASLSRLPPRIVAERVVGSAALFGEGIAAVPRLVDLVALQLGSIWSLGMEAALGEAVTLARSVEEKRA